MARKKTEKSSDNKAKPGEALCRNCNYGAAASPCANCGYKPK